MKDVYYFSHDSNARHDPKCSALIHEFGPEGYGVFWMVIELLSEQSNYRLKKFNKLYEGLAAQFSIEHGRLRSIIEALLHDYELLLEDEKYIWSESLLRRMEEKEKKRQAKVEAGRKGGVKSGVSRNQLKSNEAETKQNEAVLEANEPKESKAKESKIKNIYIGSESSSPSRQVSDYFIERHHESTNAKYLFEGGKDGKILATLLKTYDVDFLKNLIDWYFTTTDEFIRGQAGYSIGVMKTMIPKFIASKQNKPQKQESIYRDLSDYMP